MGATLDALRQLQDIETQLRSIRERIASKRRSADAHKRRVASLERQIADTHLLKTNAQAEADKLELDRASREEHIAKLRDSLNRTKTNKEYSAILTQLNTDKSDGLKLEDQVLAALSTVDELKAQETRLRAEIENEQRRAKELDQAAADFEAQLSRELGDLESQRTAAAEDIPPESLTMFERACERHDGEGMARAVQTHPKRAEYVCGGCNMSMTLETINALQSRDVVCPCQTCLRILYLDSAGVPAR
jgi:predicted  nucleic acid-binding Zn-ribbon protein